MSADGTKAIARGASVAFAGQIGGKLVRFSVFNILIARVLGPASFGVFALGFFTLQILQQLGLLGLHNGVMRFGSDAFQTGDRERAVGIVRPAFAGALLTSTVLAVVTYSFAGHIAEFFSMPALEAALEILAAAIPCFTLLSLCAAAFRAQQDALRFVLLREFALFASIGLFAGGAIVVGGELEEILLATLAGTICAGLLAVFLLSRGIPGLFSGRAKAIALGKLLRYSVPTSLVGLAAFLLAQVDRAMVAYFLDEASVGLYSVAATIATQVYIIQASFNTIFTPRMAAHYERGELEALGPLFQTTVRWTLTGSLLAGSAVILLSKPLVLLSGRAYLDGVEVLVLLAGGHAIFGAISGIAGQTLQMCGRQNYLLFTTGVMLLVNIVLNAVWIQSYGANGAALATVVSIAIGSALRMVPSHLLVGRPRLGRYFLDLSEDRATLSRILKR